jgi:hypothetical protein
MSKMAKDKLIWIAVLRIISIALVSIIYIGSGTLFFAWWLKYIISLKETLEFASIDIAVNLILFGIGLLLWFFAYWFIYALVVMGQALALKGRISHENLYDIFPELKDGSKIFLVSGLVDKKLSQILSP